jgi:hypothetical protein
MNKRTAATLVLALVSFTGAQAQVELPNQWVDQQMKAASQERAAPGRMAAVSAPTAALASRPSAMKTADASPATAVVAAPGAAVGK